MNEKENINKIEKLLRQVEIKKFPRLVYFYFEGFLIYDRGAVIRSYIPANTPEVQNFCLILNDNFDRKEFIDALIQIEFLLFELTVNYLNIPRAKMYEFIEFSNNLGIRHLAKKLKKWGLLKGSEWKTLQKLIDVRNEFAHGLVPQYLNYNGDSIFEEKGKSMLINDLNNMYQELIKKIQKIQLKSEDLIEELESLVGGEN